MDFNRPQNDRNRNTEKKDNNEYKDKPVEIFDNALTDEQLEYFDYLVELPLFPDDFKHYKGDKRIGNEMINQWIEECIVFLESEKDESFATAQAGDTKIVILRIYDDSETYHYEIEIFKDRYTIEIYPEEL